MASTYNSLGYQLMATGENAGTWGTKTNTTLDEIKDSFGYISVAMTADRTLTIPNGSTGTYDGRAFIIELTGTLGGTRVLDIAAQAGDPAANIEKPFIVYDNTTHGGDTLTFKVTGQTGFALTQGATYLCYHNGTDIINTGFIAGVVDDTSPQLGGNLDVNGNDIVSTSNTDIDIIPNGTGDVNLGADTVQVGDNNANATITTQGTGDLILNTNNGTNSGNITIADGANGDITITPDGTGVAKAVDAADATGAIKIAGKETIFIPAQGMFGTTTNGANADAVETTATRPELKVLDFDAGTAEYAQFSIAMPKSWDLGTVTYQVFWSPGNTDTGNCIWGLQGVSVANDATADIAFGTAVEVTDAGGGAVEDVLVSSVSGAITVGGSPADDYYTFFQLYRDAADGSDTFTGDARLLGIKLFYTTDAANDA